MTISRERAPVSVVIPVWNGEALLGEALESVFGQTRPPEQVIVVDDGSTDGTAAVIRGFAGAHYVYQPNAGAAAARNAGARLAAGSFIAFLDADDLWPPERIERQMQPLLDDLALDFVAGSLVQVKRGANGDLAPISAPEPTRLPSALLLRRAAFDRVGGFKTDYAVGETVEWFARAMDAGLRGVTLDEIVLLRRVHARNLGKTASRPSDAYLRVLRDIVRRRRGA